VLLASLLLAVLAILLAWPVPVLLAAAEWPSRSPAIALLLWQAIALAGGLSMIGALLTFGLAPFGDHLVAAGVEFVRELGAGTLPAGATFLQMFALSGAILFGVHLVLNLALTTARTERQRRRHSHLIALLGAPMPGRQDTLLLDDRAPVAYCLPWRFRSVTVLSAGLLELLDTQQLEVVVAHERAHVSQRHHIVLLAFAAWRRALPWFPIASRAQDAVAVLIEMLADDRARRVAADAVVATTVVLVASGVEPPPAAIEPGRAEALPPGAAARAIERRVRRVTAAREPLPLAARATVVTAAVALVAVPTVLLFVPAIVS
jgi:Zn-dependent protease with chaperone function